MPPAVTSNLPIIGSACFAHLHSLCPPGGPLCEGDIEEADGVLQVFCPWHDYNFDLRTGKSGTSLQVSDKINIKMSSLALF